MPESELCSAPACGRDRNNVLSEGLKSRCSDSLSEGRCLFFKLEHESGWQPHQKADGHHVDDAHALLNRQALASEIERLHQQVSSQSNSLAAAAAELEVRTAELIEARSKLGELQAEVALLRQRLPATPSRLHNEYDPGGRGIRSLFRSIVSSRLKLGLASAGLGILVGATAMQGQSPEVTNVQSPSSHGPKITNGEAPTHSSNASAPAGTSPGAPSGAATPSDLRARLAAAMWAQEFNFVVLFDDEMKEVHVQGTGNNRDLQRRVGAVVQSCFIGAGLLEPKVYFDALTAASTQAPYRKVPVAPVHSSVPSTTDLQFKQKTQ